MSLNPFQQEYLLSGSADKTVRVWDLDDCECKATYSKLHTDKVQAVRWNKCNEQLFVSGGYDGRLCLQDVRTDGASAQYLMNKKLYKDIESLQWHPTVEQSLVATTESGHIIGFDTRNFKEPVFSVQAHQKACSAATFSPHHSGMLATVGSDSICKVWDVLASNSQGKPEPKQIAKRDLKQGELFSVQFYQDIPWVLAAGGSKGEVAIWDTEESVEIEKHFKPQLSKDAPVEPKAVAVEDDGNEDFEDISSEEEKPKKKKKSRK